MVLPTSDFELFMPAPVLEESSSKRALYILFWLLLVLAFAHLSYGDFWGFLLDLLFSLLGYVTLKRLQLSTMAFFSFLCAFNAGIDLMASISVLSSLASSSTEQLQQLATTLHVEMWQLVTAAVVITLDAIVFSTCLVLTCKLYSDLRSNIYSQLGLLGQPLLMQSQLRTSAQPSGPPQATEQINHGHHAAFRPIQGRAHRLTPETV